ncbi:hypothetical protein L1887_58804 [Cichorium endivia]|nr:hypothetical protein L1887_58804 [Cichorium endivia]
MQSAELNEYLLRIALKEHDQHHAEGAKHVRESLDQNSRLDETVQMTLAVARARPSGGLSAEELTGGVEQQQPDIDYAQQTFVRIPQNDRIRNECGCSQGNLSSIW